MNNDDLDAPENFDKAPGQKPSLKEAWDSSPAMKLVAVVLGAAVLMGGYMAFLGDGDKDKGVKSMIRINDVTQVKQAPGQEDLDESYRKALEDANKKTAVAAAQTGGSALPTPIGSTKGGSVEVPVMPEKTDSDVLAEWRKATEASRAAATKEAIERQTAGGASAPEMVPMVQPVRPQQAAKQDPDTAKKLAEQMRVIITAQAPLAPKKLEITKEQSPYIEMKKAEEAAKAGTTKLASAASGRGGTSGSTATDGADAAPAKVIVPAGAIAYAQLLTELNSDIKGPALAQVLSGPFAGGRIIGKIDVKDEFIVINFNRVVKDAVSYKIEGIALDEKTTLAGQATDVDHHYMTRVILPAAAKFIEGYGSSVAKQGSTAVATAGGGSTTTQTEPSAKENVYKGIEESSKKVGEILDDEAKKPITVKVAKGTTMGVFFMESVTTEDVEE